LRCFYGEALHTGEDLRVELRNLMASGRIVLSVLVLVIGLFMAAPFSVAETGGAAGQHSLAPLKGGLESSQSSVSARELDDSIRRVMSKVEYAWRMSREKPVEVVEDDEPTFFDRIFDRIFDTLESWGKTVRRWWKKVGDWLDNLMPRRTTPERRTSSDTYWIPKIRGLMYLLLAAIACMVAIVLWRAWKRRRKQDIEIAVEEVAPTPDITDEHVDAGKLPEDGWLALAKELMEKGQLRLSLRAIYLASLACLAENELLTIAKFKSDREYERELKRRAHAIPHLVTAFTENVGLFERAWYGMHEVTRSVIQHFAANYKKIKAHAER
jgi:hypothetical protein